MPASRPGGLTVALPKHAWNVLPMTANGANRGHQGQYFRNNHLWLLAAVFGVATVHAGATTLHDTTQRRAAARLVARATAERVTQAASSLLESLTQQAFAPATPVTVTEVPLQKGRAVVDALLREHQAAERCRCRAMLPVLGYYRYDVRDGALDVAMAPRAESLPDGVRAALTAIARAEHEVASARGALPVHLWAHATLGAYVAVTSVPRDARGEATAVLGIVGDRRAVVAQLFTSALTGGGHREADAVELARLDSQSVEVRGPDGVLLFGGLDSARRFRATVNPRGPLEGLAVTLALAPGQIASPLIAPIATGQLWHLALLMLGTVVVVVIAVRSSHRAALLARARSDFVAGVSHELRMPLAQILLASETLTMERARGESDRLKLARSIVREARRLIALVENVLLFSRAGAVELRPHRQPLAVDELMLDVVEAVQLAVEDARQTLDTDAAPMLAVVGDRTLLRQALVNLVDNAMKYGAPGQRIRLIAEQASPDQVRLIVEDEGRGVPYAERVRVFEPYERLARDQTSERTGTGLGLAVVRQIVAASNGRAWLEETARGGTRAVLELPSGTLPAPTPEGVT